MRLNDADIEKIANLVSEKVLEQVEPRAIAALEKRVGAGVLNRILWLSGVAGAYFYGKFHT